MKRHVYVQGAAYDLPGATSGGPKPPDNAADRTGRHDGLLAPDINLNAASSLCDYLQRPQLPLRRILYAASWPHGWVTSQLLASVSRCPCDAASFKVLQSGMDAPVGWNGFDAYSYCRHFCLIRSLHITALSIAETGCSYRAMRTAFIGIRTADIPDQVDWVLAEKWSFIVMILYNPILALVKTSALLFLLRLGGQKRRVRIAIISLLVFNAALMISIFICCIMQCKPIDYFWERAAVSAPKGSCFDMYAFYVVTAALTILTDILVLSLPFWIFLSLKLPLRVRLALVGVFVMGGVVTVMSILRLAWLVETLYYPKSDNKGSDIRFIYSSIETNMAIVCACAPALRPLCIQWFPRFFSSLKSSANKYSRDQNGRSTDRRSRHTTTILSSHHHNSGFALKEMNGRLEIRSHSPTASQEEIMTYNGILKTSEVAVDFAEQGLESMTAQLHLGNLKNVVTDINAKY
ncbi:hypothetical protein G7046_g4969 [Stylonectria norvegica]|nr:hypothetical protein G7046_g4969 [Stylonectria norvegica]